MKVAIIGSGLSALTAGATLSRAGHQVDLFEQFRRAGGVTAPYRRDGFTWDLGQLIVEVIGPDEPVGEILADPSVQDRYGTYDLARGLADGQAGAYHGGRDGCVVHVPGFH